jgi:hypothetical protein
MEYGFAVFGDYLLAGEKILWCGRPRSGYGLRPRLALFGVVAIAALLQLAIARRDPAFAAVARRNAIVFAAIAIAIAADAMIAQAWLSSTWYAITSQRVLILSGIRRQSLCEIFLDLLTKRSIEVRVLKGAIEIRPAACGPGMGYVPFSDPSVPPAWATRGEIRRLVGLDHARVQYELIVETARRFT